MPDETQSAPRGEKSIRLANRVYQAILSSIADGTFPPNTKLPGEHQLAARFAVSRPVVRAALAQLKQEHTVISRQGAGNFVCAPAAAPSLGFAPVETIADVQRCYEFRLSIEPDAAACAALRHNEAALGRIAAALEALAQATRQSVHRDDADFAFHLAIAAASNNHYYQRSMLALQAHISAGMHIHGMALLGPKPGLALVFEEHGQIFEAIRRRQADAARGHMAAHLRASRDRLFENRLLDLSMP